MEQEWQFPNAIENVRSGCNAINEKCTAMGKTYKVFVEKLNECEAMKAHIPETQVEENEAMKTIRTIIEKKQTSLQNQLQELIEAMKSTQSNVSDLILKIRSIELPKLIQIQKTGSAVGKSHLEEIQHGCKTLAETSVNLTESYENVKKTSRSIVPNVGEGGIQNDIDQLGRQLPELMPSLIKNTFFVETHPPQVLKISTPYSAKVRLLGYSEHSIFSELPKVTVSIIDKESANKVLNCEDDNGVIGTMKQNVEIMQYDVNTNQMAAAVVIALGKIIRKRKLETKPKPKTTTKTKTKTKTEDSVLDEKVTFKFTIEYELPGGKHTVHLLSLPVVLITHERQEAEAWGTIFWDTAFAQANRQLFVVPDQVNWRKLAFALSMKFQFETEKCLSDDHLKYLADKLLEDQGNSLEVSWTQFAKNRFIQVIDKKKNPMTTFWEWFYAAMELTKLHLKQFWKNGHIHGFITKSEAKEMLDTCPDGGFILRFSDSVLGGISIAWAETGAEGTNVVRMLTPLQSKDLKIRSLADRLNDLKQLKFVLPDVEKSEAFACKPVQDTDIIDVSRGYVGSKLAMVVLGTPATTT